LTLSDLRSSSLFATDGVDGDVKPLGDVGESPFGVCESEGPAESAFKEFLTRILVSEALLVSLHVPMPFFSLNFLSQIALVSFRSPSLWFTPVANL
jgi:hypothetical protein